MDKKKKIIIFLLRVSMGWLMLYAGVTKIINPEWTAKNYLVSANTFSNFYQWLASDNILPIVNFLNEWGLVLVGASLIAGIWVKISSFSGALLMALYYFPILTFPYAGEHSYIVDEHVIYIFVFMLFLIFNAGRYWGLDSYRVGRK
jgi:thiosulfate dehydrogenase [quinone] large subunit